MKVYVDELPKSCLNCVCFNKINGRCQLDNLYMDTDLEPIECPLQSLADYTKQVRKEVVQEIKGSIKDLEFIGIEDYVQRNIKNSVIYEIDQIQGETNGV